MNQHATIDQLMQVGLGFWASKTLLSAVELGLFTELSRGPQDFETLRGNLQLHPRSARDFLDALVALGFLHRTNGTYHNTPTTEQFLDKGKESYLGGMLEMANNRLYGHWGSLTEALRTGEPQNEAKDAGDTPVFDNLYADSARLTGFLTAMTAGSRKANLAIASKFPWNSYKTAVDVGAAQGDLIVQVALAHRHITGCGFDLPQVGPVFDGYVAANGLADRLRFLPGDFFRDDLPKADVIMMGHILHDWNLEEKRFLLRKAYSALPDGGAVVVYDSVIDDDRSRNAFGLLMSLNMLIETRGGFDYTGSACMDWMQEAGFRQTRVEHLYGPDSMVVGVK